MKEKYVMYQPKPIETIGVALAPELLALSEKLAENAHDIWALGRLAQGWTYGEKRDDQLKKHPDLVPYAQLSDDEKEFDRATSLATLKAITALGYRILPPNQH